MDKNNFQAICDATLEELYDQITAAFDNQLDVELGDGILTITYENEDQTVLNRHGPSHQIWMSSPISGPTRFGYDEETGIWRSTKDESVHLRPLLAAELCQVTSTHFFFD